MGVIFWLLIFSGFRFLNSVYKYITLFGNKKCNCQSVLFKFLKCRLFKKQTFVWVRSVDLVLQSEFRAGMKLLRLVIASEQNFTLDSYLTVMTCMVAL